MRALRALRRFYADDEIEKIRCNKVRAIRGGDTGRLMDDSVICME